MKKALLIILIIIVGWFALRFIIGGSEDTWNCVDGEWVKHGNPSSSEPTEICGQQSKTYSDNEEISWEEAKSLVFDCQTEKVWQTHALQVTIILKNGIRLKTVEPKIDDIVNVAKSVQEKCGKILIGTE